MLTAIVERLTEHRPQPRLLQGYLPTSKFLIHSQNLKVPSRVIELCFDVPLLGSDGLWKRSSRFTFRCWPLFIEYAGYDMANQTTYLDDTLRWGLDWLIKVNTRST